MRLSKMVGLKLPNQSLNKSLGSQVTCKGFRYMSALIYLGGYVAEL